MSSKIWKAFAATELLLAEAPVGSETAMGGPHGA